MLPELSDADGAPSFGPVLSLPVAPEEMGPRPTAAADGGLATPPRPDDTPVVGTAPPSGRLRGTHDAGAVAPPSPDPGRSGGPPPARRG
ncbi:hypothetical protein [Pseudonocardia sp.]|uniref:hypothetical protein n=1 Tax=Pseudonocardia sp. TaxID=60912 RepID=UPI00261152B4|nr:hypothetical protein [Pseudonocardia sp.]